MAASLKSGAASAVNRGPGSAFYSADKSNPVYQTLDAELSKYTGYMKKRAQPGYTKPPEEPSSRPADTLFEIWNKYEPKLPLIYYQQKLLEIGDFLVSIKEYNLALWQCYGRYLKHFGDTDVEEITEVGMFKKVFFPSGFDGTNAGFTFRALMGKSICTYQVIKTTDPKLQNVESVDKGMQLLNFLRFVTQVILPKESLCWLVFNGTVHIYSICRHLMSLGHSSKVFEYLLWASMCIESSVPLMGVKYLTWRTTLYAAVCQCYFDCKNGQHAEGFARRALTKINELNQLESMSNSTENPNVGIAFRQATVKMAIMVYKRSVFESRKKPKGLLRPKTRANLKDAAQLPWPRTPTEKLLADMFEGSAAQVLCVVETLTDSNRRTLLSSPAAPDSEVEILDVNAELFMAAQELIAGGGGTRALPAAQRPVGELSVQNMGAVCLDKKLIDLATKGEDGVPLSTVVRIVKLAYCYEMWDTLDLMLDNTITALKETNDPKYGPDEKSLEILKAFDRVQNRTKQKKLVAHEEDDPDVPVLPLPPAHGKTGGVEKGGLLSDDLIHLAEVLLSVVKGPYRPEEVDMDIMTDSCLWLWNRCKTVFQKYQTGASDNPKYLQKMDNPSKWVYILDIVHQVLGWCGLSAVDPALTAEVVLRLALVFEASAALEDRKSKSQRLETAEDNDAVSMITSAKDYQSRQGSQHTLASEVSGNIMASRNTVISNQLLSQGIRDQLMQARDILEQGLRNVSYAREVVALSDGKSIADVAWAKELNKELFAPVKAQEEESEQEESDAASVSNTVKDLHMELLFMYHRVCLKLTSLGPDPAAKAVKPFKRTTCSRLQYGSSGNLPANYVESYEELQNACRKSNVAKALLAMQKAHSINSVGKVTAEQKQYLEESKSLIQQAQIEEKRLFLDNKLDDHSSDISGRVKRTKVPPPPVLLCKTDSTMVFKHAQFIPSGGEKIAWYRLFCKTSSGSNVKVRLNDYFFPGTGQQVPAFRCELRVEGLSPGEKYVCAVAAYTKDGQLIGGSIGETTKPILASHPMSLLLTWAFLCQVSYQVGCYSVARDAAQVLWNHFVAEPPPPQQVTYETSVQEDFKLTLHRLNKKVVSLTSPILLRMSLSSIFVHVDINLKDGALFCDTVCDKGPLIKGQIGRLRECEKLLVALELAGWLNESSMALQAVVQCYGLLAPMIHFKIPAVPVVQVLERCHTILQEIPVHLRQKRPLHIVESLHHMTACLTYHMAKVLRTWNQRSLATNINESGRRMLSHEEEKAKEAPKEKERAEKVAAAPAQAPAADTSGPSAEEEKTAGGVISAQHDSTSIGNEELKALEAHMLRLSKQVHGDHDLSGNEDPSILHAYIAYMPSKVAYKEVSKFKRRARYLEFFVQVAQKALQESLPELSLEWCDDTIMWLLKRNEQVIGSKIAINRQPGAMTVVGDDPKKFAAAMVEYSRDKEGSPRMKDKQAKKVPKLHGKKSKYKAIGVTPNMTDAQRQAQEESELKALQILSVYLVDRIQTCSRHKRFRKICTDEAPWRSQLNIVQGLSQFGVFRHKLEFREKIIGNAANHTYKTSFLDQEWFSFETAGTLVVGWEGGPSRLQTRQGDKPPVSTGDPGRMSGIEVAARVATGKVAPGSVPDTVPEMTDSPRTGRPEAHGKPGGKGKRNQEEDPESALITPTETREMLGRTFNYFKRAVVLAHRGHHWILLQNAARALWNCAHNALLRTCADEHVVPLINLETLRAICWEPFYTAADCLLDMLVQLQQEKSWNPKKRQPEMPVTVGGWTGDIKSEKGGASLKFEELLDDITSVDLRFVTRIVRRVLELLHHEQRWERLVDIALRFNAVTDDRYVEQVNPLLVQAQRKLVARVKQHDGPAVPQPHFKNLKKLTSKQYTTKQLRVVWVDDGSKIDPGARMDPEGHDVYSGGLRALQLCCVPLDVNSSLQVLRPALDKSNYTGRALQHSRKLLSLYLAGQQNSTEGPFGTSMSHVDFVPNTARPQPTMPVDLNKEEFLSLDDIQSSSLPRSQIGVVMSSYDKTIELLVAGNQKGLASQAMRELANLLYHTGNIRGAYRWWSEALDILLNVKDALHNWRQLQREKESFSQVLLEKCGLWGCILGGVITSNVAQYILTSDLGLRTECCFLSGYFFKALFRSSLPHPTADRDYALYEVGEGCEVTNLVPGVDLMSERFRCDGRTLIAALRFIMDELGRGKHGLFVLPILTLYQYWTTFVCRDLQRNVDGRILKVRVLTDIGLFAEAFTVLQQLLNGDRLPHTSDSNFRQLESRSAAGKFDSSKPILEPNNLKVLESVLDKRLSSNLSNLYGPHLTCHLTITQAHLFVKLSNTLPVLPRFEDVTPPGGVMVSQLQTISTVSRGVTKGPHMSFPSTGRPANTAAKPGKTHAEEPESSMGIGKKLTQSDKPVSLEVVKGTMIAVADQMLNVLADVIMENASNDKGVENLSAAELEMVVLCKLEMAEISNQRHHAAMASRIVLMGLKIMQASNIFNEKKESAPERKVSSMKGEQSREGKHKLKLVEPESSQLQYQNFQSRSRLDARLWLEARLALVRAMMGEIRGMGQVKGSDYGVKVELGDVRKYCAEGVAEAEACGDTESQAEFLMQGVLLDMMEGSPVNHTKILLKEIIKLLSEVRQVSPPGELLKALSMVHLADLNSAVPPTSNSQETIGLSSLKAYCEAQNILLNQLQSLGEKIEHRFPVEQKPEFSVPCSPLRNIYSTQLLPLVQIKLRIGHVLSRNVANMIKEGLESEKAAVHWAQPLGVLGTALNLSQVITTRVASVEAEIVLNMGKIQRQMYNVGAFNAKAVVDTLLRAIKTSCGNDHDLGLIHQAYLELAVLLLTSTGQIVRQASMLKEPSTVESAVQKESIVGNIEGAESGSPKPESPKQGKRTKKQKDEEGKKEKPKGPSSEPTGPKDKDKKIAWIAVRCAAAVGQAIRSRQLLTGHADVTSKSIDTKAQTELPEFAMLDMISSYVLGERKRVYKDEIEEELAPLTEALEPPPVETYADQMDKARKATYGLSWVQVLGYQSILRRLCSTMTMTAIKHVNKEAPPDSETATFGPEFDIGFISHQFQDMTSNCSVVRSVLFSPVWSLRLNYLHQYLAANLNTYAAECTAVYPPTELVQMKVGQGAQVTEVEIISKCYDGNKFVPEESASPLPPASSENPHKPSDKLILAPQANEVSFQWYQPSLEHRASIDPMETAAPATQILTLWAVNKKSEKPTGAMMWVNQHQLIDLHDRLSVLTQRGEISLVDKEKGKKDTTPAQSGGRDSVVGKTKKQARIKALSPKVKRDELLEYVEFCSCYEFESLLKQCMTDVLKLLGVPPEEPPVLPEENTEEAREKLSPSQASTQELQIPFDVTKSNVHSFEQLFDPSYGGSLKDPKMVTWLTKQLS